MSDDHGCNAPRRALLCGVAALGLAGAMSRAQGQTNVGPARTTVREGRSSAWSQGMSSRIRLVDVGAANADGLQVAAIEIALDKGFKTYWRSAGDSGIPPVFSFEGSENAGEIAVHFPPPVRFDDGAGGFSIGYLGPMVALPVTFRALAPGKPVKLAMKMDYAVCEKICVPASGTAELPVEPQRTPSPAAVALLAGLPRKQALALAAPVTILKLVKGPAAEHFRVDAALPAGIAGDLFIEAASPWFFEIKAGATAPDGTTAFTVLAVERDKTPDCKGVELTLTLIAGKQAIETTTWLDVTLLSP